MRLTFEDVCEIKKFWDAFYKSQDPNFKITNYDILKVLWALRELQDIKAKEEWEKSHSTGEKV